MVGALAPLLGRLAPAAAQSEAAQAPRSPLSPLPPLERLRRGGVVVMLRHAATDPGIGDPPGFKPGVCSTQRNLSPLGRAQAQRIGAWFRDHRLVPAAVHSSEWCRCLDTATLAFGTVSPWVELNSFFGDSRARPLQTAALRHRLTNFLPVSGFQVWVTHQVNVTALTGENLGMGDAVLLGGPDSSLAQLAFS